MHFLTLLIGLTINKIATDEDNEDDEDYEIGEVKEYDEYSNSPEILSFKVDAEGNKIAKFIAKRLF